MRTCGCRNRMRRPPRGRSSLPQGEAGFTLIETMVAALVLAVGLLALFGFLDTSVKASASTLERQQATNLARQILEDARGIPYAQLSPGTTASQLQALPGLANTGSESGWQVERSGRKFTIALEECAIDDGKGDVWGNHKAFPPNTFCGDPGEKEAPAGGPFDPQPEDLKRITVDVTWIAHGRSPDVHEVETLSADAGAPGLSATELQLESPEPNAGTKTAPVITNPIVTELTFSVSAPAGTAGVRWSLEGVPQSNAPTFKAGTTWTFTWAIPDPGVSDGTYTVAAQAIDSRGVLGPPVSIQVTLVRNVPAAVRGLKGGFNTVTAFGIPKRVVELQWQPNEERNVIGYRVYRPGNQLACPEAQGTLSTATACIDFAPPQPTAANLTYTVTALYFNAKSEVTEGTPATIRIVGGPPPPPNSPKHLSLTHTAEGAPVLTWEAPSGGEPVIFYRIYRNSTDYTSRYDTASEAKYIDTGTSEEHEYWVTAVDENLTESAPVGPVKG